MQVNGAFQGIEKSRVISFRFHLLCYGYIYMKRQRWSLISQCTIIMTHPLSQTHAHKHTCVSISCAGSFQSMETLNTLKPAGRIQKWPQQPHNDLTLPYKAWVPTVATHRKSHWHITEPERQRERERERGKREQSSGISYLEGLLTHLWRTNKQFSATHSTLRTSLCTLTWEKNN